MRDVTVAQFMHRYHVDALQARRVGALAFNLYRKLNAESGEPDEDVARCIAWASKLHEIGISVAFSGYHKHSAYIVNNADMPGFSNDEQLAVSLLVLAHRRSLNKVAKRLEEHAVDWNMVFALRLAALFYRSRADVTLPSLQVKLQGRKLRLVVDSGWLARNPLTATARERRCGMGQDRLRAGVRGWRSSRRGRGRRVNFTASRADDRAHGRRRRLHQPPERAFRDPALVPPGRARATV
jgi:exopolyphosphatase/guanosine-5'-triphosphate,3'-diphosphate pyrophosphatase